MGQCSALHDISLVASIYAIFFRFLIAPPSLIWFKLCERTFTRATDTLVFPEIVVFPCLTMSQNHGQHHGPNIFKSIHRNTPIPTCTALPMSSLTTLYHFFPPCPDKGWFLVLYPFLGQYFAFSTPSWTLQTFKTGIVLQNVQHIPIQDCEFWKLS